MRTTYILKWCTIIVFILPLFFFIQTTSLQSASAFDTQQTGNHPNTLKMQQERKLTHKKVIAITNKFEDLLVQETDNRFKVIHYNSRDEILDTFEEIASKEIATSYVDFYFDEKSDGLYIVPTELPPWLNENKDYDMIQLENNKVSVIQENESNFYGDYTIKLDFSLVDKKWKITNIVYSYN